MRGDEDGAQILLTLHRSVSPDCKGGPDTIRVTPRESKLTQHRTRREVVLHHAAPAHFASDETYDDVASTIPAPVPPQTKETPTESKCARGHIWTNDYGDDWTPDRCAPCDCGGTTWGDHS
jgi:hypothetical protein